MVNKKYSKDKSILHRLLRDKQFQIDKTDDFTSDIENPTKEKILYDHYSIVDLIWLNIASDLRKLNTSDSQIEGIKHGLYSTIEADQKHTASALEYYISEVLQMNVPIYIVLTDKNELFVLNDLMYFKKLRSGALENHINISLNKQIKEVIKELSRTPNYCELKILSKEEVLVVDAIRSRRYKFINISIRSNGKVRQLEGVEEINRSMTLEDVKQLMDEGEHQNIEIKRHHGKIVAVHRRERKRLLA